MFGNPLYIWAFPEYTVARATEEMSAEYATVMQNVAQIWMLPVMIAATVVLALVGSMFGKDVYKRQGLRCLSQLFMICLWKKHYATVNMWQNYLTGKLFLAFSLIG